MSFRSSLFAAFISVVLAIPLSMNLLNGKYASDDSKESLSLRLSKFEERLATLESKLQASTYDTKAGMVRFGEVLANLNDGNHLSRYIKMSIVLSVEKGKEKDIAKLLNQFQAHFRDSIYLVCAEKSLEELRGRKHLGGFEVGNSARTEFAVFTTRSFKAYQRNIV